MTSVVPQNGQLLISALAAAELQITENKNAGARA
jgi:hypothetical protein